MKIRAAIPVMFRSVNLEGIILDCNQYYAVRMGYTMEEVIGQSIVDHATDEYKSEVTSMLDAWKSEPATHISKQTQLKTKMGEVVTVLRTIRKKYEVDKVIGIDTELRDVAGIKKIQNIYNISNRKDYEDPDILRRSVDYMGTIVECNKAYLDNLGYTRDEVIGISLYEHTAQKSRGNLHANMENWRAGYRDKAIIWMRRKDGSEFPTMLESTDEKDENGVIVGRTVALKPIKPSKVPPYKHTN